MPGLIEAATGILASSERRVETAAQNISNAATPGYKRQVAFTQLLDRAAGPDAHETRATQLSFLSDFAQGKLRDTGRPLDLALFGPGFLRLRDGESYVYARGGSFAIGADGAVIDSMGRVLQEAGGSDLTLEGPAPQIAGDGSVIENGLPVAMIGLFEPASPSTLAALGGGLFRAPEAAMQSASVSVIHQGRLESANVVMSDEMIAMMAASRQAEGGARLVQFYDQLIGQAITTFSRSGK